MRRFRIVFAREFKETLRSKPFIVISVFLLLILLCIGIFSAFLAVTSPIVDSVAMNESILDLTTGFDDTSFITTNDKVAVVDKTGCTLDKLSEALPTFAFEPLAQTDEDFFTQLIEAEEFNAVIIINQPLDFDCYEKGSLYGSSIAPDVAQALARLSSLDALDSHGISGSDVTAILDSAAGYTIHTVGGYGFDKYLMTLMLVIVMFLIIALYGQMVSTRVATEKSSRTMEVLATSVSPRELLCGKVLGVGSAGLLQIAVFLGLAAAMLAGAVSRSQMLSEMLSGTMAVTPFEIFALCCYFILGFLLIAFIYGGLGSLVSQVEDLSGTASLPIYLFMIGYFIAIFSTSLGSANPLLTVASYVPFWSPIVMFSRMSIENVPVYEVIISILILAASCLLTAAASTKLYRHGMLRYGKPPKIKEIIKLLKSDYAEKK